MTVKDAKKKWCPMARGLVVVNQQPEAAEYMQVNRYSGGDPLDDCMCLADECACWKWDRKTGETTMVNIAPDEWQGHCGLAR